jgi:putative transposase
MKQGHNPGKRELAIARILRPLGTKPMSKAQAMRAGQLLGVHWTGVYRLRKRFLADPVASSVVPGKGGRPVGTPKLELEVEEIISGVLTRWLPKHQSLAHPLLDITMEVKRRCAKAGVKAPSRNAISRRWARHREEEAAQLANDPNALIAPGHLTSDTPLEIVQIDHTQADIFVVDERARKPIGRPWISVAIDVATRCVVGVYVAMERPNAGVVALLLTRIAQPKALWLHSLGLEIEWPMHGIPQNLHLDNAAEFKSRALRVGCGQYGIDLMYRPVRRPHFGGHVERMNRTLMDRLRGVPGATGNSVKGRQERKPEKTAALTLREFERWLVLEVGQRYHHSEHRGLMGATPASVWQALTQHAPQRILAPGLDEARRFLVQFLPMAARTIQADGLTIFYIHYWHPIFAAWRETRKKVIVRYHPEDLSRIFVSTNGKQYVEVAYADLRRPRVSLWEQRQARKTLRAQGNPVASEMLIFQAIVQQRHVIEQAQTQTRAAQRKRPPRVRTLPAPPPLNIAPLPVGETPQIDYSRPVVPYHSEIW